MNKYKPFIFIGLFLTVYAIFIFFVSALYTNIRIKSIEEQQDRQLEVNEYILNKIEGVR